MPPTVSGAECRDPADRDDETRAKTLDALRRVLAGRETPEGVLLGSGAWLITARRP